jgi:hypothetical protein
VFFVLAPCLGFASGVRLARSSREDFLSRAADLAIRSLICSSREPACSSFSVFVAGESIRCPRSISSVGLRPCCRPSRFPMPPMSNLSFFCRWCVLCSGWSPSSVVFARSLELPSRSRITHAFVLCRRSAHCSPSGLFSSPSAEPDFGVQFDPMAACSGYFVACFGAGQDLD